MNFGPEGESLCDKEILELGNTTWTNSTQIEVINNQIKVKIIRCSLQLDPRGVNQVSRLQSY
jgi:hypothetical protein